MENEFNKRRLNSIYQMLFEIAYGNFTFSIERSEIDDEFEGLIVLINMIAEELRSNELHNGLINSHFTVQYLVQNTFILNQNFFIKSFNVQLPEILGYSQQEIFNSDFSGFLSDKSQQVWGLIKDSILSDSEFHKTIQISFKSKGGLLIPAFCTITRLLHDSKILISSGTVVAPNIISGNHTIFNDRRQRDLSKNYNAKLIQRLYDYILQNLDSPLPTVKELSSKFATNEHKLKDGFKHFFKTSIYQFYNDERLKRAHLLIQQTELPLKMIADLTGFNNYTNFSKAFKKRFSYSPNQIVRNNSDIQINGERCEK